MNTDAGISLFLYFCMDERKKSFHFCTIRRDVCIGACLAVVARGAADTDFVSSRFRVGYKPRCLFRHIIRRS